MVRSPSACQPRLPDLAAEESAREIERDQRVKLEVVGSTPFEVLLQAVRETRGPRFQATRRLARDHVSERLRGAGAVKLRMQAELKQPPRPDDHCVPWPRPDQ